MRTVHIGLPKTATTYLQEVIFPQFKGDLKYFDKASSSQYFRELMDFDDSMFDVQQMCQKFGEIWNIHDNVLFSCEMLTGLHHQSAFVNRSQIARRLKEVGFQRVIISIRNQYAELESAYRQYIKSGGVLKFDDYISFEKDKRKYFYVEYFDYSLLWSIYSKLFGHKNVLILQYEHLYSLGFLKSILDFIGLEEREVQFQNPVNTSLSLTKTNILRILNHFTCNTFRPSNLISNKISTSFFFRLLQKIPFFNQSKSYINSSRESLIKEFYGRSNSELEKLASIELDPQYPTQAH